MVHEMRQAGREVLDLAAISQILLQSDTCHLGLSDEGQPYVVPLNYGFEMDGKDLTLYFHCARQGRKLAIISRNSRACFQMDCAHELKTSDSACGYSMNFASVIGSGLVEIVEDHRERLHGLQVLMQHYSGQPNWAFAAENMAQTVVLRLRAVEYRAKVLRK